MEFVGIGNALIDRIAFVPDDYALSLGFRNDSVNHLPMKRMRLLLPRLPECRVGAGGGAANAARTAALLGMRAFFAGSLGNDADAELFIRELERDGVESLVLRSHSPTGLYCGLIRADGRGTIIVSPSAALDFSRSPPSDLIFRPGAFLFVEGFLVRERRWLHSCLSKARAAGMRIVFDLGNASMVRDNRDFLLELLPEFCELVFANEDELCALAALPPREGLCPDKAAAPRADIHEALSRVARGATGLELVVKRGEKGALWTKEGRVLESPARRLRALDATAAGDVFDAAFLAGRAKSWEPERCLRLALRCAETVLGSPGFCLDRGSLEGIFGDLGENIDCKA